MNVAGIDAGAPRGDSTGSRGAHRQTRQRQQVRAALAESGDFVSAQSLFTDLKAVGSSIGLATVYRTLNDLVESGEADSVRTRTAEQLYRLCGSGHHHHLICTRCGKTIEVRAPLESWLAEISAEYGFSDVHHIVELYGVCADCRAAAAATPASQASRPPAA